MNTCADIKYHPIYYKEQLFIVKNSKSKEYRQKFVFIDKRVIILFVNLYFTNKGCEN